MKITSGTDVYTVSTPGNVLDPTSNLICTETVHAACPHTNLSTDLVIDKQRMFFYGLC